MAAPDEGSVRVAGLVARALTGEPIELGAARSAGELGAALQDAGWDVGRLVELRDRRRAAGLAWPFVLTAAERGAVGVVYVNTAEDEVRSPISGTSTSRSFMCRLSPA